MAGWQPFNEKHPFGKGATVVSSDNIAHAQMRRMARKAMEQGSATPEQIELVNSSEMLIKKAVEED
jgi:hypothetical protein